MADNQSPPAGPDLALGVSPDDFKNDMLLGHVGEDDVLLVRAGSEIFAIDAHCSHYHGPLADGLVTGHDVRCPWHHACFDLRTGEAVRAPALSPLSVLEGRAARRPHLRHAKARRRRKRRRRRPMRRSASSSSAAARPALPRPRCCGATAMAASITMLSNDSAPPVDRPNLSKDYLAGSAPEDWMPLRPDELLCGREDRSEARDQRRRDRRQGAAGRARRRQDRALRPPAARDRRRAGAACRSPAPTSRMCTRCARSPTAAPSSRTPRTPSARSSSARASSGSRSRRRCAPATSRCMSSRPRSGRWSASSVPTWATSCARCMRSMA